ncbi:MAG TPA: hypothetical protein VFV38_16910 [Ktedonobacteraceae bacterium]|nr:hypothetical protein [Ktedonobacteraceae bacterium]
MERLTIARESLENTLEYIRYRLTAYLRNVVPSSLAYQYGFFTIARYLEKYEKLGFDPEGVQKVLEEIYRYQNIFVNTSERVYIVESKKKNAPFWQVYFPHLNEDDKMAIMFNCQPSSVIDGYTWDVFFLPQIIGETLMNTSFGEGKRIEAFSYKIGFNMNDYEYLGFP